MANQKQFDDMAGEPWIDELTKNVEDFNPGSVRAFTGFLMKVDPTKATSRRFRLFSSLSLNEFIEFDEKDVVYWLKPDAGGSPAPAPAAPAPAPKVTPKGSKVVAPPAITGSIVWLRQDAQFVHGQINQVQAGFLEGRLGSLGASGGGSLFGDGPGCVRTVQSRVGCP
jgi:hypothetical protein